MKEAEMVDCFDEKLMRRRRLQTQARAHREFIQDWHKQAKEGDAETGLEYCLSVLESVYEPKKILDVVPGYLSQAELYWAVKQGLDELRRLRALESLTGNDDDTVEQQ